MKFTILALLAGSAAAFAPAQSSTRNVATALNEKSKSLPFMERPEMLDGSMPGDVGFDPLNLSAFSGVGVDLYWLREAEIKHGRVAMLAAAGAIWVELFGPAPGNEMVDKKCQTDAFWQFWDAHPQYIAFSLIFIGLVEMISGIATTTGRETGQRAPGDFGLDPLKIKNDPAKLARYQLQEIKNGRLAMWAAAGIILQGLTTHSGAFANLNQIN